MRVTVELPDWVADAVMRGPSPTVDCGPSLAERLAGIAQDWADSVPAWEAGEKRQRLYKALGLPPEHDDENPL